MRAGSARRPSPSSSTSSCPERRPSTWSCLGPQTQTASTAWRLSAGDPPLSSGSEMKGPASKIEEHRQLCEKQESERRPHQWSCVSPFSRHMWGPHASVVCCAQAGQWNAILIDRAGAAAGQRGSEPGRGQRQRQAPRPGLTLRPLPRQVRARFVDVSSELTVLEALAPPICISLLTYI